MDTKAYLRKWFVKLPVGVRGSVVTALRFYNIRPVLGPLTYNQDGLSSRHSSDFMSDPRFARAYNAGWATNSWDGHTHWRVHVLLWAASQVSRLEGDFVECGVNRGGYSRAVMEYLDFNARDKKFWLLDTFQGLEENLITDQEKKLGITAGGYDSCLEEVKKTFAPFSGARIIPGAVPGTLSQVEADKVCYLSIDMNCVEPEMAALEFFWPRLVSGAIVILDDYGWKKHGAQKQAQDAFAAGQGLGILSLPTGQGLLIKP